VDQRAAVPACAELLHAAAGAGGAATGGLYRLADAPDTGRYRLGHSFFTAGAGEAWDIELGLFRLWPDRMGGGAVLRLEGGGAGDCVGCGGAHRPAGAEKPGLG